MSARIIMKDIVFYAYHGFLPQERELGQEFRVSFELELEQVPSGKDLLEDTVDYRSAVDVVRCVMEGEPRQLLETLAAEIAAGLSHLSGVSGVKLRVEKPHPPIPAVLGGVSVEINHTRGE